MNERKGVGLTPNRGVPLVWGDEMTLKVTEVCEMASVLSEVFFLFSTV